MKARRIGAWMNARLPGAHRAVQPAWRLWRRFVPAPTYWGERRHLAYYRCVVDLARVHAPSGGSALDVGAADTKVIDALTVVRSPRRARPAARRAPAGDRADRRRLHGLHPPAPFDLVLCLQVLEHLADPGPFARKLLAAGTTVVLSVPYRWPGEASPGHCQDPVDEEKLARWVGQATVESRISRNGRERLVAVYRGAQPCPATLR